LSGSSFMTGRPRLEVDMGPPMRGRELGEGRRGGASGASNGAKFSDRDPLVCGDNGMGPEWLNEEGGEGMLLLPNSAKIPDACRPRLLSLLALWPDLPCFAGCNVCKSHSQPKCRACELRVTANYGQAGSGERAVCRCTTNTMSALSSQKPPRLSACWVSRSSPRGDARGISRACLFRIEAGSLSVVVASSE
jgi:hypothetical protein